MPSSLGSMKMEAMAKPRKTRAPRKVIFLIEMNLGFDYTIIHIIQHIIQGCSNKLLAPKKHLAMSAPAKTAPPVQIA